MDKPLVIYTIVTRPDGRKAWVRIGSAVTNRDGSIAATLDALPVNGALHLRAQEAPGGPTGEP